MRRTYDHEERILQDPVSGAIIASAVIGAGTSLHASSQQRKAQKEAEEEQRRIQEEERTRAEQIAADTRPEGEAATIAFGSQKKDTTVGSFSDFLVPKSSSKTAGLSTGAGSGLGFGV